MRKLGAPEHDQTFRPAPLQFVGYVQAQLFVPHCDGERGDVWRCIVFGKYVVCSVEIEDERRKRVMGADAGVGLGIGAENS